MSLLLAFFVLSCEDDNDKNFGSVSSADLDAIIVEAQAILNNLPSTVSPGDYKAEAILAIQEALDKALEIQQYAYKSDQLAYGVLQLRNAINYADGLRVSVATPWIQQENDTYIQLSDNFKDLLGSSFTIEIKYYVVDVRTKGHSNNLFSVEQPGPDRGFAVRYYSDGKIQVVVGNGSGWPDTGDQAGAGTVTTGEWIDLAVTNDGTRQILYINGTKVAENEASPVIPENPFVIGNSPEWTDRVCNTVVKDFRVWNSVLDATVIEANRSGEFDGTEDGLECYFPFNADLGTEFKDLTGNYTATLNGKIEWVTELPPAVVIEIDYTSIDGVITKLEALKPTIVEGNNDGDYPTGTISFIDELITGANDKKENAIRQSEVDDYASYAEGQLDRINSMLVGDANGVFIDRNDPDATGFRITPNYTPQGNYTVEFEVNVKSLFGYANSDIFNNGQYGLWVFGYTELTEENVLNSGGLRNFTRKTDDSGWETGPTAPPLTIKTNNWHHIAITHDENVDGHPITILYVDGIETGRDTISIPAISGWSETWLGNGWGKMDGYIKNFRIWDEARTEFNADITGIESNLRMYFPLDRIKGIKFKDETGNFDGEMRGISWNK